jgi:hypothetical protein
VRTVEHAFRPRPPVWVWLVLLSYLTLLVSVGYLVGWRLAAVAAVATGVIALLLRPSSVRLERDEQGVPHLAIGRGKETSSVDLSRLVDVSFLGAGYGLQDEEGAQIVGQLDGRLRSEVRDAASRRRLQLNPETESALLSGRRGALAPRQIVPLLGLSVLVPLLLVGVTLFRIGGIELGRDNHVDAADVRAAIAVPGAVANPFLNSEPRELYLVGLDATSQRRLPRLADVLEDRFGMAATQTASALLDVGDLNSAREQLDGWRIASRLLSSLQSAHPGRLAVVIAVTRLDTFLPGAPYRFVFMTGGDIGAKAICGGVISTARFDMWPGSTEKRIAKMASRLLGRCLGIEEDVSIRSIHDVDRLDDRAGADEQTVALRVAERRALPGAPRP